MKVYVVTEFSAEPYEYYSCIHKVFYNKDDAQKYINDHQDGPYNVDMEEGEYGYFVSTILKEYTVE